MHARICRLLLVGLTLVTISSVTIADTSDKNDQVISEFAAYMAEKHQFEADFIIRTLQQVKINQDVLNAIARPWEAKPWHQYYPIFLTEKRLAAGVRFWQQHQQTLLRAEQETGVPAEIIVAIIGVETFYGTYQGNYSVLESLYTLGFHYPPRSKFFKSELEEYFLLTREEGFPLADLKGSYAGAMGWGQFISSSYRHYAIDFDGDGVRDLLNNPVDAIGSVANYFKRHNWKPSQPVAFKAEVDANKKEIQALLSKDLKYKDDWESLKRAGVALNDSVKLDDNDRVKLLKFDLENDAEYWVGLPNFYVITRYNHSPLYAMAVYQFSQQLKQAMSNQ